MPAAAIVLEVPSPFGRTEHENRSIDPITSCITMSITQLLQKDIYRRSRKQKKMGNIGIANLVRISHLSASLMS